MSKSTDRERARLNAPISSRSTRTVDGLTTGRHPEHVIFADSDEEARMKLGILGAGPSGWQSGITYGNPADAAAQAVRDHTDGERYDRIADQSRLDSEELRIRREADLLTQAAEAITDAALAGWVSLEANQAAAAMWESLDPRQRANLVASGEVPEEVADELHGQVWPAIAQRQLALNAQATEAAGSMQRALTLMNIKTERGMDDATFSAYTRAVAEQAHEKGIPLEGLGTAQFEQNFRAAEVILAENKRADANAEFQAAVLNSPSTDITSGLEVLGANGYVSAAPGGLIEPKPDYAKAAARLGGRADGPEHDSGLDIKKGIVEATSATEGAEWNRVQEQAGALFSAQEEARIKSKLGER